MMLSENLTMLRKAKALSQEELAQRLHVVRQTVSKWEKGLSVPDVDMLIQLAELFETSVSDLLGSKLQPLEQHDEIAQKLEQLNALLAERNKRSRLIWRVAAGILLFFVVASILCVVLNLVAFTGFSQGTVQYTTITTHTSTDTDNTALKRAQQEQRLAEALQQQTQITAAEVHIDEDNHIVTASLTLASSEPLPEEQLSAIKALIENTLDTASAWQIEIAPFTR